MIDKPNASARRKSSDTLKRSASRNSSISDDATPASTDQKERQEVLSGPVLRAMRALACFQRADDLATAAGVAPVTVRRLESRPLRQAPAEIIEALTRTLAANGVTHTLSADGSLTIEVTPDIVKDFDMISRVSDLPAQGRSTLRNMNAPLPLKMETLQAFWSPRVITRKSATALSEIVSNGTTVMQKYREERCFFGGSNTIIADRWDERAEHHPHDIFAETPHAALVSGAFYAMRDTVIDVERMQKFAIYRTMGRAVIAYHAEHGTGTALAAAAAAIDAGISAIENEIWRNENWDEIC